MPRLIHMMYFPWGPDQQLCSDTEVFERGPYENMKQYAPDFSVSLWTYARISEFGRLYYPAMWEAVCALPRPVMMVDILRWLVVYHFGGIFWQYHMAPLAPMERVLPAQGKSVKVFTEFVNDPEFCRKMAAEPIRQGEPEEPLRIATQAFSAEPRHPFGRPEAGGSDIRRGNGAPPDDGWHACTPRLPATAPAVLLSLRADTSPRSRLCGAPTGGQVISSGAEGVGGSAGRMGPPYDRGISVWFHSAWARGRLARSAADRGSSVPIAPETGS